MSGGGPWTATLPLHGPSLISATSPATPCPSCSPAAALNLVLGPVCYAVKRWPSARVARSFIDFIKQGCEQGPPRLCEGLGWVSTGQLGGIKDPGRLCWLRGSLFEDL